MMKKMLSILNKYLKNLFISIDQLINTIFGGDPDMTISARLGRYYKKSWVERSVDWLFRWQGNSSEHCENADWWESDEGKDAIAYFINQYKDK